MFGMRPAIFLTAAVALAGAGLASGVVIGGRPVPKAAISDHPGRLAEPRAARPAPIHVPAPVTAPAATPALAAVPQDANAYVIKGILPVEGPMRQGDWYWDDSGVPQGKVFITADLAAGTLSIFRAGYEIGTAVIIIGDDATPTPLGVFPITQKDADHHSNIYDNAPMPFMLRLTNDGISVHGSEVGDGYVTHGCIGVPVAFAKKLFGAVKLGDVVIVTRGKMVGVGDAISRS